jgi:hypothetical protein
MMSLTLRDQFDLLWKKRWNQDFEEVLKSLPDLQERVGMDGRSRDRIELRLLEASLLRARGHAEEFHVRLEAICIDSKLEPELPIALYYERGLHYYMKKRYVEACEDFLNYARAVKETARELAAYLNAFFCMDSLGYDGVRIQNEIETRLSLVKDSDEAPLPQIRRQWYGHLLQEKFFSGNFAELKERARSEGTQSFDSPKYFFLWTQMLPWMPNEARVNESEVIAQISAYQYQKTFRIRTLLRTLDPADKSEVSSGDLIDRLYLWTWDYLVSGEKVTPDHILDQLQKLFEIEDLKSLSARLSCLALISMSWLEFLDSEVQRNAQWKRVRETLSAKAHGSMLLDLERHLQDFVRAFYGTSRDAAIQVYERMLALDPSAEVPFTLVARSLLTDRGLSPVFEKWKEWIEYSLKSEVTSDRSVSLAVDLRHWSLVSYSSGKAKRIVSQSLCEAIVLLKEKKSVSLAEFALNCFGIRKWDPVIHFQRLFNLQARLRRILPEGLSVHTRDGRVHVSGDWDNVLVERGHPLLSRLRFKKSWVGNSGIHRSRSIRKTRSLSDQTAFVLLEQLNPDRLYRREELETILGGSKATTVRRINDLVDGGKLLRSGSARATRYQVLSKKDVFHAVS